MILYTKNRAWIELDLEHLKHNVRKLKELLPSACALMPAVKANAYGHGAVPICLALKEMGIRHFCVASAEEGIALREAGIPGEILILGYTSPRLFPELSHFRLTQTVVDYDYARLLSRSPRPLSVHVKVDTGMHRLGERSSSLQRILSMWELDSLAITGVFSHLCVADGSTPAEQEYTRGQIAQFQSLLSALRRAGLSGFRSHLLGSYGILNYPGLSFDLARPGIALYGVLSSPAHRAAMPFSLKPVLSLKARIECVHALHLGESIGYGLAYTASRETAAAVVSIGYADGVPRQLSNLGAALVHGKKVPMIGRICMDQLFLDVTGIPGLSPGDEAILIGRSDGQEILAEEMAFTAGTISNELLSRLGERVGRVINGTPT